MYTYIYIYIFDLPGNVYLSIDARICTFTTARTLLSASHFRMHIHVRVRILLIFTPVILGIRIRVLYNWCCSPG